MNTSIHRLVKAATIVLAVAGLVVAGLLAFVLAQPKGPPSAILDYAPSEFVEKAAEPFFYSIGNELRFGDHISPNGTVLFKGPLRAVISSPDEQWALVVSDKVLWIVGSDGSAAVRIVDVDDLDMGGAPGRSFFRYDHIQWASDSSRFFLIKDETYNSSRGSHVFSIKGELTEYDVATRQLRKVFAPFRAFNYFLTEKEGIFFEEANDAGDVILKVWNGTTSDVVVDISPKGFRADDKEISFSSVPFYSFPLWVYAREILLTKGVLVELDNASPGIGHLSINGRRIISIREGHGLKGHALGINSHRSGFLPGEHYFILDTNTRTFDGQLLFDLKTGRYKPLPKATRIYRNINTHNFADWTITDDGVQAKLAPDQRKAVRW